MGAKPLRLAVLLRGTALLLLVLYGGVGRAGGQVYSRVTAKDSELCAVCRTELTSEDPALIVRGRRTPLCQAHVETFLNNLERSFSSRQPRGALFQEDLSAPPGTAQGGISRGWFLFGLLVLSSLIFGGLSGYRALSMGLPPLAPFFVGFFLNLPGFLYVVSRPAGTGPRPGAPGPGQGSGNGGSRGLSRLRGGQPPHRPAVPGVREGTAPLATIRGDASLRRPGNESPGNCRQWH